jgi:hypothetical protein
MIEIVRRLQSGKSRKKAMASCDTGSSAVYDIMKWKD